MTDQPIVIDDSAGRVSRRRRRIRRVVLLALLCLPFAFVFSVAWPFLRPLTENEQRLVGTWRNTTNPAVFTFHADRTITSPGHPTTKWCFKNDRLRTTEDFFLGMVQLTLHGKSRVEPVELEFRVDDHISVNGGAAQWQRVTP